jgi:sec-independent protein translocase protein TatA
MRSVSRTGVDDLVPAGPPAAPARASRTTTAPRNPLITCPHPAIRGANTEKSMTASRHRVSFWRMPFVDNILQPTHLLLILVVALLVLGPKRLPEAGRALGKGIRDFRSAMSGEDREPRNEVMSQASTVESAEPQEPVQAKEPVQPLG